MVVVVVSVVCVLRQAGCVRASERGRRAVCVMVTVVQVADRVTGKE